ncbi:hypothetical protein SBOR_2642 [Sclerotinia borealis F-4128]|uniref:Uncharacterized protein n=1 Tax=Sclerotinia borealis (strain F-4128) TaxID=1432307 RepID=W9CR47_SCLBF|nr:hypothetical protein SBOR_2642 [Sclerotinia borealis F-4128]
MRTRNDDFKKREKRVQPVFRDVGPSGKGGGEPTHGDRGAEDNAPVHDGYEERVADDGAVVEGMEGLQGTGKFIEEGCSAVEGIAEGVERGEEKIEG